MRTRCGHLILLLLTAFPLVAQAIPDALLDRFGGYRNIRGEATGFFRTERIGDRWFLITPEGHGFVALGANHVGKFLDSPEQSRSLIARLGSHSAAEDALYQAMRAMGLNAGEAYAPLLPSLARRLPYVVNLDFPGRERFRFDPFDPAVRNRIAESFIEQAKPHRDDPMVIGVALMDIPVWDQRRTSYYRSLAANTPGKQHYIRWLRRRYTGIDDLNRAYGLTCRSFEEFAADAASLVDAVRPEVLRDDHAYLGAVADEFYAFLRQAVRAAAPNHLFLGERFVLRMYPDQVISAVGKHVDLFCTQALILSPRRPPEWQRLQPDGYWHEHMLTGRKPMMIIDWAAPFSLREPFDAAQGRIEDEPAAARRAADWLRDAFRLPFLVGVFKCQLIGLHGNDLRFPPDSIKRTYLKDDGSEFPTRTPLAKQAHHDVLRQVYGIR